MTALPDKPQHGRVVLITGANTGIGRVAARRLAQQGARLFIASRSLLRTQPVLDEIRADGGVVDWLELDLGDLASVRRCAQAFLARDLPLHVLVNNAGVAGARGLSASGFELTFGTNHVGTFLFTQLLLERLKQSAPARVVTVASRAHIRTAGFDWDSVRRPTASRTGFPEYCLSKLANLLFSAELGRRLTGTGVTTYALHPGVVASDIWRKVPWPFESLIKLAMISPEKGALTTLYCATAPELAGESGLYYDKCRLKTPARLGRDEALAGELWRRTEQWLRRSPDTTGPDSPWPDSPRPAG